MLSRIPVPTSGRGDSDIAAKEVRGVAAWATS